MHCEDNEIIISCSSLKVDIGIQTESDLLSDDAPEFAPRPPNISKSRFLQGVDFSEIDLHSINAPEEVIFR